MREMALKKGSFTGNKHTGGLNMEITLEQLNEKIDNLSRLTLISSKTVLDFEETILFTGLSKGHLYRPDKQPTNTILQEKPQTIFQEV